MDIHETRIPISEAHKHPLLRRPKPMAPVHRSVIQRWITRGVRGVVLETVLIGGIRWTSAEAIQRFIERQNTPGATSNTVTPSQIAAAHAQAETELDVAGV